MSSPRSSRAFVISITTFDADGRLDEAGFRSHLRRMGEAGIGVYVGGGGSGEGYVLHDDEALRILEIAADELTGVVPVRAMGVEPRSAAEMIRWARSAEQAGIDAVQVYSIDPGHGRHPRPDEVEGYFRDVLEAIKAPVVLSTHQSVGYIAEVELLGQLLDDYPHLIGINCTNPDLTYLVRLVDVVAGRADIHVGGPTQALAALAVGAQGYLISEANLAPRLCSRVVDSWAAGDLHASADAFRSVMRLFDVCQRHGGVSGVKAILGLLGLPAGQPRRPRLPIPESWHQPLLAVVDDLGLRELEGI